MDTPPMPASYPDAADLITAAAPDISIAEAYWIAACQALGVSVPGVPSSIRVVSTMGGWRVQWREDGKLRQRSFGQLAEADEFKERLSGNAAPPTASG